MERKQILVVDDEEDILELVRYNLVKDDFEVHCVTSGEAALKAARSQNLDLVVLDLMLPGMDGLEVARILKSEEKTQDLPIVMLTARGEEADVVTGLELGADDYITKPFSPRILNARIKAVIRRGSPEVDDEETLIRFGELTVDPRRRAVNVSGSPVDLTFTEFQVLLVLARRPGWVFTRTQIVDAVHGDSYPVTDRSVDVQIVGLRKKLGDCGRYIQTVRGVGYRFAELP
jgi:two-component system, OmpR family, alkaline phosphatase synthesis response regulator PhoP